jgi:hypothetical protein
LHWLTSIADKDRFAAAWGEGGDVVPRTGDVLYVTQAASVQFTTGLLFRVIRVHDWPTYDGWAWLDGYQLNRAGEAIARRSIFVQVAGLRAARTGQPPARGGGQPTRPAGATGQVSGSVRHDHPGG